MFHRLPQCRHQFWLCRSGDFGQEAVLDLAPGDRDRPEHLPGCRGQRPHAGQHEIPQLCRQREAVSARD
jgi:hypothetical protein